MTGTGMIRTALTSLALISSCTNWTAAWACLGLVLDAPGVSQPGTSWKVRGCFKGAGTAIKHVGLEAHLLVAT